MDYAAYFTRHDNCWELTFPDFPQDTAMATTCNELFANAELELAAALCKCPSGRSPCGTR